MTEPTRLFDCIERLLQGSDSYTMVASKENGSWKKYTAREVAGIVDSFSAGLLKMGIGMGDGSPEGRDKIAVVSKNRPEWLMLDLAVQKIGAVLIPVYPTINAGELEFILKDAAVKMVFVNDLHLFNKVNDIKAALPDLREIYSFEKIEKIHHWKEIISFANDDLIAQVKSISDNIAYEDLATIIYTSGTTGTPKGVMLSHKNILSNVLDSMPCFPPGENLRALSFLPLNHIFERMVSYLYFFRGSSIYFAESLEKIGDNLKEVKPQMFTTVPYLLEKVYEKIMQKGRELHGIKRKLFFWAHNIATRFEINKNRGFLYNMQLSIANKLVFKKWREALGGEIRYVISGGAACQVRLIRIFTAAKIIIMEGYGLTETSPVISVNRYEEEGRMFGTVGPLIRNVQVKIADDGEILCKGPNVMKGYYKRPDLTAESMEDGWYKTGDIGILVDNKFLKITDRKKEMFKTSGGKYVAPVVVENKLKESPYVGNIMITGAGEKYTGALITPSFNDLKQWARLNNIDYTTNEEMVKNEQVLELYKSEVERYNHQFSHVEKIKRFELLPHEWSVETGEMTPKLSLKRKVILEKYKDAVRRIYA